MGKILIPDRINIDVDMFMTSFEDAATLLLEQKERLEKEGWSSIHLKMEYYNEGSELIVMGARLENDDEYNKRLAAEQRKLDAAERKAKKEYEKYEKLKLKFNI